MSRLSRLDRRSRLREIQRLYERGWTIPALSVAYDVSARTIYRAIAARRSYLHYCEAGPCPVVTPRPLCYYHARSA